MKISDETLYKLLEELKSSEKPLDINCLASSAVMKKRLGSKFDDSRSKMIDIIEKKKWQKLLLDFAGEYQLAVFLVIQDRLTPKTYWKLLGEVLKSETYIADFQYEILLLVNNSHKNINLRDRMMSPRDRKIFANENRNYIFRGCTKKSIMRFSWTLDLGEALKFAARNPGTSYVYMAEFDKKDVIAFYESESEIFIAPRDLKNVIPYYKLNSLCEEYGKTDSVFFKQAQRRTALKFVRENKIIKKIVDSLL
jgi:hypothetical protein